MHKKIVSIVGARPNFMKIAPIHRAFQKVDTSKFVHTIVHTGQHYDARMSDAFFADLDMPTPSYFLGVGSGSHAVQTAKTMIELEKVFIEDRPDLVLVPGDVNSTLAATIVATKMGIPVGHIESGLRSFDRTMPEELNRIATDVLSDILFVTEQSGLDNLLKEGISSSKVHFVGNTMIDSLHYALPKAETKSTLEQLGLAKKAYGLITIHRPSNVDEPQQLEMILKVLQKLSESIVVVFPIHPRTRKNIELFGLQNYVENTNQFKLIDPQGYVDFLNLMRYSTFVMTDSGGIQEETTALQVPCVTIRTTTERPSTVDIGTNILIDPNYDTMISTVLPIVDGKIKQGTIPQKWDGNASERVVEIVKTFLQN